MNSLCRGFVSLLVAVCVSNAAGCTVEDSGRGAVPVRTSARPSPGDGAAPGHAEHGTAPLASELEQLRQALTAQDAERLERLLSPGGVLCGDFLYGRREYDALVRRPDGRLRPWLFGAGESGGPSARSMMNATTPLVSIQSADHRSAEFASSTGALYIGFTLRDGKWLISEGLFCQ
jgi:hypothetical protein